MSIVEDSFILENLQSICRLCMKKCDFCISMFSEVDLTGSAIPIIDKLTYFVNIQVEPSDCLPTNICYQCLVKVEKCFKFKNQCSISDGKLRQILCANEPLTPNEIPEDILSVRIEEGKTMADVDAADAKSTEYDSSSNETSQEQYSDVDFFNNAYLCQICDQAFVTSDECVEHKKSNHDPQMPYNCQPCCLVFTDRLQHIQHLKKFHGDDKPYGCPECKKGFQRRSDLRKHTIVHTGIRPYKCRFCLKTFSRNNNLSKHLRIHSGHKPFVCSFCSRGFVANGDLQRHIIIHSGEKPYACSMCPLTFCRKDKMLKHEVRHKKSEPVDKEVSAESSSTEKSEENFSDSLKKTALLSAKIVKTKLTIPKTKKSIKCNHCTKRFPSLDTLKKHISQHMIKNFPCKICYKKFGRKRDLDKHDCTTEDRNSPYNDLINTQCVECGESFTSKEVLVAHLKAHINEDSLFLRNDLSIDFRKDVSLHDPFQDFPTCYD